MPRIAEKPIPSLSSHIRKNSGIDVIRHCEFRSLDSSSPSEWLRLSHRSMEIAAPGFVYYSSGIAYDVARQRGIRALKVIRMARG
jgi:hypothetical protein